ncbi:hypothetical protein C8J56DRAFT_546917 [Mycena floridula]|nr:hypothetical protein C8J56DRAFT_546917 [Mycena floridula]
MYLIRPKDGHEAFEALLRSAGDFARSLSERPATRINFSTETVSEDFIVYFAIAFHHSVLESGLAWIALAVFIYIFSWAILAPIFFVFGIGRMVRNPWSEQAESEPIDALPPRYQSVDGTFYTPTETDPLLVSSPRPQRQESNISRMIAEKWLTRLAIFLFLYVAAANLYDSAGGRLVLEPLVQSLFSLVVNVLTALLYALIFIHDCIKAQAALTLWIAIVISIFPNLVVVPVMDALEAFGLSRPARRDALPDYYYSGDGAAVQHPVAESIVTGFCGLMILYVVFGIRVW